VKSTVHKSWLIEGLMAIVIIALVVVVILVDKNHNSNKGGLSLAAQNSAKQQIKANWQTFFAYSTPLNTRESLLENGSKFSQPINSEFSALSSAQSSATVTSVSLVGSTSANVVYTVDLNKQPVLTNQKGQALKVNNQWVVSDSTLCGLLSMAGSKPTVCQGT
jgi:hypothetical protein